MALVLGVNSYVTVEAADSYFEDRLDSDAWTSATPTKKAQALVTSSRMLNELPWLGVAAAADPVLAFPRVMRYYDATLGEYIDLSGAFTPQRVMDASCELAIHMLLNEGLQEESGDVSDMSVSKVKLEGIKPPPRFPLAVKRLVGMYQSQVDRSVWRSN